jgi:hypothetical protein
LELSHPREE